jgi:tetratricopeptide (TPR) repeat protein
MPTRKRCGALVLAICLVACALHGCQQPKRGNCGDEVVVDAAVLAFLSKARSVHHTASIQEAEHHLDAAIGTLQQLHVQPQPPRQKPAPEVEEVLADTDARISDLQLQLGNLDAAREAGLQGLTHAPGATYFRGHLLEVLGLIEEARSKQMESTGQAEEAIRARAAAIKLLEESIGVQDQVIRERVTTEGKPR